MAQQVNPEAFVQWLAQQSFANNLGLWGNNAEKAAFFDALRAEGSIHLGSQATNIMATLFFVFKEAAEAASQDKKYWLRKLKTFNNMGEALGDYLDELTGPGGVPGVTDEDDLMTVLTKLNTMDPAQDPETHAALQEILKKLKQGERRSRTALILSLGALIAALGAAVLVGILVFGFVPLINVPPSPCVGSEVQSVGSTQPSNLPAKKLTLFQAGLMTFGFADCAENTVPVPIEQACGNGTLDTGEQCDGSNLTQCLSTQQCSDSCQCIFVEVPPAACGNGVLDPDEQCDGSNLAQCLSTQQCSDSCQCIFMVEAATPTPPPLVCGNGVLDPGEQCDGSPQSCGANQACNNACQCVFRSTPNTEYFAVYDCKRIGADLYEWHGARVVLGPNGEHLEVTYVDGPHQGPWQPFCPGGDSEQGDDGGDDGSKCVPSRARRCRQE